MICNDFGTLLETLYKTSSLEFLSLETFRSSDPETLLRVNQKRSISVSLQDADWWTTLTGLVLYLRLL